MPVRDINVVFTVDTETPQSFTPERCDAPGIIEVSQKYGVAITWFIYTNRPSPRSVVEYYEQNFFHLMPDNNEIGLHTHYDEPRFPLRDTIINLQLDPAVRKDVVTTGYDTLVSMGHKPVSHRTGCLAMESLDIKNLETAGIIIDSSTSPGIYLGNHPGHGDCTSMKIREPYNPDYNNHMERGDAKLIIAPISSLGSDVGVLEYVGFHGIKKIVDYYIELGLPIVLVMHDGMSESDDRPAPSMVLEPVILYLREKGANFITMSDLANLLKND